MYLKNAFIISENDDALEIGNANDLRIENWSSFDIIYDNDDMLEIVNAGDLRIENRQSFSIIYDNDKRTNFLNFSFDFKIISHTRWKDDFDLAEKDCYEIASEQLKMYEYKAVNMLDSVSRMFVYRIPRTFTITYNETTLISTSMRANLYYLYWLLTNMDCRDIITHIKEHLFAHCQYDYSLYICAN